MPILNRSAYYVTVKNNPSKDRTFPHDQFEEAVSYADELRKTPLPSGKGFYKPLTGQLEDAFLLRIRRKGYPEITETFSTEAEAKRNEQQILAERTSGLVIDYRKSQETTASILKRFIEKELAQRKTLAQMERDPKVAKRRVTVVQNDIYVLQAMLDDSTDELKRMLARLESGEPVEIRASRTPMGALYWLHKPFADLSAEDIDDWMSSRLGDVEVSTIWRQFEQFRAFVHFAVKTWDYRLQSSPTAGVSKKKWKFMNDRNRLLQDGEEAKMIDWARAYDRRRVVEPIVRSAVDALIQGREFRNESERKRVMAKLAREVRAGVPSDLHVEPVFEGMIQFQIMVGTRRSELLGLTWSHIDLDAKCAHIPMTKNGLPRTVPLRSDIIDLLRKLDNTREAVFGLTHDRLIKAWRAMREDLDLEDLHFHDLRHEAITRVARTRQFTILELQDFSGHKDLAMLKRYTHYCPTALARKLDQAFAASAAQAAAA